MEITRLMHGGHGRLSYSCLLAVSVSLGVGLPLIADDDHRRDRDRDRGGRDTHIQINVNVGGSPRLVPPPCIVDNRGPIHEAFAEPVVFDPKPGLVVSMRPPTVLTEVPPRECPEGDDVRWIPGYWGWDDDRSDYVWISGIWRNIPPGRQFIPGYWCETPGGYQWVPGCWQREKVEVVQYLSPPPAPLDPEVPEAPPQSGALWVPGVWLWASSGYAWRPGYWIAPRQEWVWVPDHYVWTPRGHVFVNGYWDYVLPRRGVLFAPVYVPPQGAVRPTFVYTPDVVVNASLLIGTMFARPRYEHFYFGDYYDRSYFKSGIYPVVSFHNSRYGYDPSFAHCVATRKTGHAEFIQETRDQYRFRREHPEARPPRAFSELHKLAERRDVSPQFANHLGMAEPLSQAVRRPDTPFRFKSVPSDRVDALRETEARLRQFVEDRKKLETQRSDTSWRGAVFNRSDRSDKPRVTISRDRAAQPAPRSALPVPTAAKETPSRVTELKLERSPVGSRARGLLEMFKPTPAAPKAPPADSKIKPGSRVNKRREPQP